MSQAIQHNSQVMMTRHPNFLRTAEALRPALSRQAHPPIAVVEERRRRGALRLARRAGEHPGRALPARAE